MTRVKRLVVLACLLVSGKCSFGLAAEGRPPNIVLIVADDQGWDDFGFMGNEKVRTPHLDRLASRSARYVNGYLPTSVCRPSLATLLTGLYPHQHGIHFNHPPPGFAKLAKNESMTVERFDALRERAMVLIESVPTLPRLLANQGYRCLQTGKHWEGHWRNAGFTEGMTTARPSPGAKYGNLTLANGEVVAHGNGDHGLAIGRHTMQPIEDFIDDCGETPFLVWYAPFLPHTPHDSPAEFLQPFEDDPEIAEHLKPYYASIAQFDHTVGQLVQMIEKRGMAERTVFLVISDNGWKPIAKRAGSDFSVDQRTKRSPFDAGVRTPILIRWVGHVVPATHDELVSSVDVVPTLLAAADVETDEVSLPGIDLLPSARAEQKLDPERAVFGEIYPGDATSIGQPSRDIAYRFVRQRDMKLIVSHSQDGKQPWRRYVEGDALFDVMADPHETENVFNDPSHAATVRRLRALLDDWWTPGDGSEVAKVTSPAVEMVQINVGDLSVHFRDNSQSPRVLSGVQSLFNVKHAPGFDAYDPDGRGSSAGLNFEHIISGHESEHNKFTPRRGTYSLHKLSDGHSGRLVRKAGDSPWRMASTLTYTVKEPCYVDFEFRCTPEDASLFGERGWASLFFANYMNEVQDTALHFRGVAEACGEEQWIRADAPPGHVDWNKGGTYRHLDAAPLAYDDEVTFRLNSWSYDWPRFTEPFYYGLAENDMTLILMFDRAHSEEDEMRMSLFEFKVNESQKRPAWDFQYVIHKVEAGKEYGFCGRLVWKKFVSREDCQAEYSRWTESMQ